MERRLIVVGLDGATFDIIDPLVSEGELPTMARLIGAGTTARLASTIPYATMPAWPSFMTGKNPGKHGVYDFFTLAAGERRISNSSDIRSLTLWEILGQQSRTSIVMNVPGTFPPFDINGIVVSGMLTPAAAAFTSPPDMQAFLNETVGGYRINHRADIAGPELLDDLYEVAEKQKASFVALLQTHSWDFAMIVFRATDVVQHHFWHEPEVIRDCYRVIDGLVGDILSAFSGAAVFVISDHGAQAQLRDFHINKWLIDQGYMGIRRGRGEEARRWEEIGRLEGLRELAEGERRLASRGPLAVRLGAAAGRLRLLVPSAYWGPLARVAPPGLVKRFSCAPSAGYEVDWDNTHASAHQAFGTESKAIRLINLDESSREDTASEIASKLLALRDGEAGQLIVRRVYRREELYWGPYADQAPDMILDLYEGYNITNTFFADSYVTRRQRVRGCHHPSGIFVAAGDDIRSAKRLNADLSLLDIAPLVLHYLGCRVPEDCDGRVPTEVFRPASSTGQRSVQYESMGWEGRAAPVWAGYEGEERAEIEERLRALGYL